jgi:trans-2,3-dihydro-3-hydroxyanthranilate isomerase
MREYRYCTCDVFTDRVFGGNPLAVLVDAQGLADAEMQAIAREFNFSETTFVTPAFDSSHTARVRIFTPGGELPFAGHPTVGTAFVLASTGTADGDLVFEEGVGPVPVRIDRAGDGRVVCCTLTAARLPELGPTPPDRAAIAAMLGLAEADLTGPAECWSCGVDFLFIPLASAEALTRARLDLGRWRSALDNYVTQNVYPFAQVDDSIWRARMFAPGLGVPEDPATGSAAAALAGWLASKSGISSGTLNWEIRQGDEVGRPSRIFLAADLERGAPTAVRVGGASVMVCEGVLRL